MSTPRLKIVIDKGPSAGAELLLTDAAVSIGRDPKSDLALLGDEFVSSQHARIVSSEDGPVLRNLSLNGTLINGRPVLEAHLAPGDRIAIGRLHLLSVRPAQRVTMPLPPLSPLVDDLPLVVPPPVALEPAKHAETSPTAGGFRMPVWLMVYLVVMGLAFVFFAATQARRGGAPGLNQIQAQEEAFAASRKLPQSDTDRVIQLLATAAVHERRGDPRSAYETYRETLGVRQPINPDSPAYRYAASRIGALGPK